MTDGVSRVAGRRAPGAMHPAVAGRAACLRAVDCADALMGWGREIAGGCLSVPLLLRMRATGAAGPSAGCVGVTQAGSALRHLAGSRSRHVPGASLRRIGAAGEDRAMTRIGEDRARVTYRATLAGGCEAAVHLVLAPEAATLADGWRRLAAIFLEVDPAMIEIEIRPFRPGPSLREAPGAPARIPLDRRPRSIAPGPWR